MIAKGEGTDRLLREIGLALAGRRGATILVAEDDADLRGVLTTSLTKSGHRVVAARDGAEALAAIERDHIDVLVLDLVMPNIDGFEVLARLKELRNGESIPVIVVTGTDRSTTERRRCDLGANVFLSKPIDATALAEEVTRLLTRTVRGGTLVPPAPTKLLMRRVSVAFSVISFLSRKTTMVTSPVASSSSRIRSPESDTRSPLIEVITSPALMPAFARRRILRHARHQHAAVRRAEIFLEIRSQ